MKFDFCCFGFTSAQVVYKLYWEKSTMRSVVFKNDLDLTALILDLVFTTSRTAWLSGSEINFKTCFLVQRLYILPLLYKNSLAAIVGS